MNEEKQFYTVKEFASLLGRSEDNVRDSCQRGNIKGKKTSEYGNWMIPRSEIERLKHKAITYNKKQAKKDEKKGQIEPTSLEKPKNWITDYETANNGKLPPLPDALYPLAPNYSHEQPISKDIQLIIPGMQFWARLLPSEKEQLLQLIEWLGQDRRDYEENMRRRAPPGSGQKPRLIPNHKLERIIRQIDENTWVELEP
ncbi:MAG: helix-turn-helix domain-containing protein [Dehalococcoidia bacterium]|jgi:hypothetical protein